MDIEKLEETDIYARDCFGYVRGEPIRKEAPSNKELMDKINEIIDYLKSKGE